MIKKSIILYAPYTKSLLTVTDKESITISCDNKDISPLCISENNDDLTTYPYKELDILLEYGEEIVISKDVYLYHIRNDKYDAVTIECLETENGRSLVGSSQIDANNVVGLNDFINNDADVSKYAPNNTLDVNYATLKGLKDTNSLVPNQWYRLTDYKQINKCLFSYIHRSNVEVLLLRANSNNSFFDEVYSESFPDDILRYNIDKDVLLDSDSTEWEDGNNMGNPDFAVSNFTATSFEVNQYLIITEEFELSVEDDDGDATYEYDDYGTRFTISHPTANSTILTILDNAVVLNHPDYNYGELYSEYKIDDLLGEITYREYPEKQIKCSFDFRNTAFTRKRPDLTAIPTFVANTSYPKHTLVQYSNRLYISLDITSTTFTTPYNNEWMLVLYDLDKSYLFRTSGIGGISIPLENNYKVVPIFSYFDGNEYVEDYTRVDNVELNSKLDIVFAKSRQTVTLTNVKIDRYTPYMTFAGNLQNMYINRYSSNIIVANNGYMQNIVIDSSFSNVLVTRGMYNSSISKAVNTMLGIIANSIISYVATCKFSQITNCNIGTTNRVNIGYANNSKLGNNGYNSFFYKCENNEIGNSYSGIRSYSNIFINNKIGDLWKNFVIRHDFAYNIFGSAIGNNTLIIETHRAWKSNTFGSYCFSATTGTYFNSYVLNNTIGSNCNRFAIDGAMNGNQIGSSVNTIICKDLYNNVIDPSCHHFNFAGNIQNCFFSVGTRYLTVSEDRPFAYNRVYSITNETFSPIACSYLSLSTLCDIKPDINGTTRLITYSDGVEIAVSPIDGTEIPNKLQTPTTIGEYTLPEVDGANGQVLTTDGSGTVNWSTP